MKHCVFYWTNLNYDGRVCLIISSLASAYPNDEIFLFEYPSGKHSNPAFPRNVKIIRPRLLFSNLSKPPFKIFKTLEFALRSFFFLLAKRPKTIQVHHEIVMYGPLAFKTVFRKSKLVYDDKELYHIKDNNIGKIEFNTEYCLFEKSDLVIVANEFRARALRFMHPKYRPDILILNNYVFKSENDGLLSEKIHQEIRSLKSNNRKILVHQGSISQIRGEQLLISLVDDLPKDWILVFIGMDEMYFNSFRTKVDLSRWRQLYNIGYINYRELNDFYNYIDACVLFYLPTTFNNNFCAPNRLFAAVNSGKPIIVNKDNYVLDDFVTKYKIGESIHKEKKVLSFFSNYSYYAENASLLINKFEMSRFDSLISYYKSKKLLLR